MIPRITPGIPAGVIGSIVLGFYGITMKALGLTELIYLDFAKVIIMSKPYSGIAAAIVGWAAHLMTGALLGMLLCFFISVTSSRFWIIKGWGAGVFTWLFLLSLGTFFKMPIFVTVHPKSALALLIGGSFWGLTAVYVLKIITDDFKTIIHLK